MPKLLENFYDIIHWDKPDHRYDSQCFCKHCVRNEKLLRLHAQHDDEREHDLRKRFGLIPKEMR